MNRENASHTLRRLLLLLLVASLVAGVYVIRNTLIPLFISMLMAYLLAPLANYLEQRGLGRILATTMTFVLCLSVFSAAILYLFPLIKAQVTDLTAALPRNLSLLNTQIAQVQSRLAEYWPTIQEVDVSLRIQKVVLNTLNALPTYLANIFSIFPLLILVPLISFFFLKDGKRIKRAFLNSVPNPYFETAAGLLYEVDEKIGSYIRGQIIRSTLVGLLTFLGLVLFGLKYSLLLGIFAGLMNLVPYAGPVIAALPAIVLASLNQASPQALLSSVMGLPLAVDIILVYVIVQTLDAVWIAPYILGWSLDIHPLGIVLLLLFGNQLFGWWGIVLAVPVAAIVKLVAQAIYSRAIKVQSRSPALPPLSP